MWIFRFYVAIMELHFSKQCETNTMLNQEEKFRSNTTLITMSAYGDSQSSSSEEQF